ncbi:hypothetical protein FRC00_002487 [Tulasnella sp. 408]|nr:hypothetical protein FRC00_002487 [Tulasnella sp. 408]
MTTAWLISPFITNGNLFDFIKNVPLDSPLRIALIVDAAQGLTYLHAQGICHGDIKPANIFVTDEQTAVIADFGLSRLADHAESGLTTTKTLKASLRYCSPELLEDDARHTRESDVWAFGCVMMETKSLAVAEPIRQLLQECWQSEPRDRTTMQHCAAVTNEAAQSSSSSATTDKSTMTGDGIVSEESQQSLVTDDMVSVPSVPEFRSTTVKQDIQPLQNTELPPRSHSSDTRHGSRPMPRGKYFDSFPDELIIYTLSFPPPEDVVRFASTSRHHKSIASTESIWFPVAFGTIRDNVDPYETLVDEEFMRRNCNRFLAALGLAATDITQTWYRIATRLLERVEWSLGWWLGEEAGLAKGCLWRIFIKINEADPVEDGHDGHFFRVIATQVEVAENKDYALRVRYNALLRISQDAAGISSLGLFRPSRRPLLSVAGFVPLSPRLGASHFRYIWLDGQGPVDTDSPSYSAWQIQDHLSHFNLGTDSWKRIAKRQWRASFSDAPYPPPLLSQLLDHRQAQHAIDRPQVPSIALLPMDDAGSAKKTLLSICRPSSFSQHANELIHTGIYVAPYSGHGWEYLLVRVRKLTEDDFRVTWPWEGSMAVAPSNVIRTTAEPAWDSLHNHLGPFAGVTPNNPITSEPPRLSKDYVRLGSKVLEGIKIKGDQNVPGGQRSFIAFLNDPLVWPGALQDAEETFPEVVPDREDQLPWPFVSQAPSTIGTITGSACKQPDFSPEQGIDIPGVVRIANTEFSSPQWTSCIVHVECKTKFTVATFGMHAKVFRKLNDWGV